VYNIKKAVSRLDFAPKLDQIEIFDVKRGLGRFMPKPNIAASFAGLKNALKKSGYKLDAAEITITGTLIKNGANWWIEVGESKQRFQLESGDAATFSDGAQVKITGDWQTVGEGATSREVIKVSAVPKIARVTEESFRETSFANPVQANDFGKPFHRRGTENAETAQRGQIRSAVLTPSTHTFSIPVFASEKLTFPAMIPAPDTGTREASASENETALVFAPIRTTSPGLTVYKGGSFTPRYSYIEQHLGNLRVSRHGVRLAATYTPTPTLQLEVEAPYYYTEFRDGRESGSGHGFGNVTLWAKYRFFRTLETWGDKQAAVRVGVELPTGNKDAPEPAKLNAPEFVRQQLSAINNGWAGHFDLSYSQAQKRLIYGANVQATIRGERDGYRLGHEIRLNTDLEYVLLPFKYRSPTKELFAIFETTYIHRGLGRVSGVKVAGSSADEFYLAPGVQYIATPRLVLEASFQLPVVMNTGAQMLKTDKNFLFGIRFLY